MKIKANKILAVLCVVAMLMTMIVPMTLTASAAETPVATFTFGANGSASHADGSSKTSYSESNNGYTLTLASMANCYGGARDAKGNSCLKLGTSSKAGSFSFTVPNDVTGVTIYVAAYKAKTATVTVNGASKALSSKSDNGVYDAIEVDTSTTKTIEFKVSSGYRAMLNTIEFYAAGNSTDPAVRIDGDTYTQINSTLELTALTENVTGDVEWVSNNENVATVVDGVVTAHAVGKATITATADGASDDIEITVFPVAESELTIAEALEVCELTGASDAPYVYTVSGIIEEINTEYSSQYNNISVTITDGTDSILVYRMKGGEELAVGYEIVVAGTLVNYGGNTPEFTAGATYELLVNDETADIMAALNAIDAYMSTAYKYVATTETVDVPATTTVIDTLNLSFTGVPAGTNYKDWSGKSGASSAVYAGNSAGDKSSIQLRSNNSNSGVITTVSGGNARKITVTWNSGTAAGRTLDVYGSNTPYTSPTELYNASTQGTKLGSIVNGTSTELEITGDYKYIAFRSNSGAMYLTEVQIEWETEGEGNGGTKEVEVLSNSQFVLNVAVDAALADIDGVSAFGIAVTAGDNTVYYTSEAVSWKVDDGKIYVSIALGDIINDTAKLSTEFDVRAFVEVDEVNYYSTSVKTYSVAGMIDEYNDMGIEEVEHLYNVLVGYGLI